MKRKAKALYNFGVLLLAIIITFSVVNFAFAQSVVYTVNTTIYCERDFTGYSGPGDVTLRIVEKEAGVYGFDSINNSDFICDGNGNGGSLVLGDDNLNIFGNVSNGYTDITTISFYDLSDLGYNLYIYQDGLFTTDVEINAALLNNYSWRAALAAEGSGFGSFLGSTTPLSIVANVSSGVGETTGTIAPIFALAGVPATFVIGKYLLWFIRRSQG